MPASRLRGFLRTASTLHEERYVPELEDAVLRAVRRLVGGRRAEFRSSPPRGHELGALLEHPTRGWIWVVVARSRRPPPLRELDQDLLEATAAVASVALRRAARLEDAAARSCQDFESGVAERPLAEDELRRAVARARRGHSPVAWISLSLSNLDQIREAFGGQAADAVLRQVARILNRSVRDGDLIARAGPSQFAVVAYVEDADAGLAAAGRLLDILHDWLLPDGRRLALEVAVATWNGPADDHRSIMRRAAISGATGGRGGPGERAGGARAGSPTPP